MKRTFPYRYRVLILLFFLTLITYLDRICISLVGVRIKSEFKLTNEQFGWVLGAFALAYALFEIPSGMLGDRIGQRSVLIRIVLCWSLLTALTGAATGLLSLLCIRFLFGVGESGAYPNASGVIARWFPATETGRCVSTLTMGANAGSALAPLIVVPLAVSFGWRVPFFVNGFIGLAWALVCYLWFRNFPAEMRGIPGKERRYIEKNSRFRSSHHPISWKSAFKSRSLWALALMWYCSQWANYFFIAWMPVYLQEGRHFSENNMKTATSFVFILSFASALLAGVLSDRLVKRRGLRFGRRFTGMLAMGMLGVLILLTAMTGSNAIVVVCLLTAHLFLGPAVIASFSTCVDIGGENAGTVAGIMNFFGQMGAFFMAVVFGKIVDMTHSFNAPLFILSGVLFAGCLLWLAIDPTKQIKIENAEEKLILAA